MRLAATLLVLGVVLVSGCTRVAGREGCPATLIGDDTRSTSAIVHICDYGFEISDPGDSITVLDLGQTPPSWEHSYLEWGDLAIESVDAGLRVALNAAATDETSDLIRPRVPYSLAFLRNGPIERNDVVSICDDGDREEPVRFWFYQYAKSGFDAGGGRVQLLWVDVRPCP